MDEKLVEWLHALATRLQYDGTGMYGVETIADIRKAATALTLAQARIKVLEADKDAAFGFISDLVNMQSGQGWSRSVVREAAANFLYGRGAKIPHGPDKTPDVIALALKEAPDV